MTPLLIAPLSGFVFGLGLTVSRMIDPVKVTDFLDVTGFWDPSLALVMAGALAVTLICFRLILRRPSPLAAERFDLPSRTDIDVKLIAGAALFGTGWGMTGYCPGPAVASLGLWSFDSLVVLGSILAGVGLHQLLFQSRSG